MPLTLNNAGRAKLSKKWKSRFSLIGAWLAAAVTSIEGRIASATSSGAAMTMTNPSPPARGRRVKFTPQVIEQIKGFVAQGVSREEIANRLGVTVGSLQVTCSRLGISLRRIILSNGSRHTADVRGKPAARATSFANFAITMRHKGQEKVTDLSLPSTAIEELALEAISRDLNIAELIGQVLVAAINKDMIQKILR